MNAALVAVETAVTAAEWPPVQEIPPATPEVPDLPERLVPDPFRPWLDDEAELVRLPLDMFVIPAMVALGAALGRRRAIQPEPWNPGWKVPGNVWGAVVGPPGALKSHCVAEGLSLLSKKDHDLRERFRQDEPDRIAARAVLEAQLQGVKQAARAKHANGNGSQEAIADLLRKMQENTEPEPRLMTCDATVEKLIELLATNPAGLLLTRDEITGWLRTLDKPGREGDRAFFLEAWNGVGYFTEDRIGRGSHTAPACVSILGGIQPARLTEYVRGATDGGSEADGLLQRFQLIVWPDSLPPWNPSRRKADPRWKETAARVFDRIVSLPPPEGGIVPSIHFRADAQELFDSWRTELENRLRTPGTEEHESFQSHVAKYRSLMPKLAMLLHQAEGGDFDPVPLDHARRAAEWIDFLEAHARKIYSIELEPGPAAAQRLLDLIRDGAVMDGMTVRDVYRAEYAGLRRVETVRAGLKILEAANVLRVISTPPEGNQGGRWGETLSINPAVAKGE